MGTNYYLHQQTSLPEPDHEIVLHIGKSSFGWCFSLHVMPERGINDLQDWIALIEQRTDRAVIKNEYGDRLNVHELINIIADRSHPVPIAETYENSKKAGWYPDTASFKDYLDLHHADLHPNNLLRRSIEGTVIGHGSGTWDCVLGDFS